MNYFLHGADSYLLKKKLKSILHSLNLDDLSATYYDASMKDFVLSRVLDDANTYPLFSDTKAIIVQNALFLTSQFNLEEKEYEQLESYLREPFPMTSLIFYCEELQLDSRKKTVKLLQKNCETIKVGEIDAKEIVRLIHEDIKKEGIEIDADALKELIRRIPPNIQLWKNELDKLCLYGKRISLEVVKDLVAKTIEDDIFMLVNAVLQKDLKNSILITEDLITGKRDQMEMVSILASQFRLMFQCESFSRAHLSEKEIVNELGIHPYRVQKAMEACRITNAQRILLLLSSLADLDQRVKLGKIDKTLGFELFLVEATR
jgi:DNA polymerase III, delta subunit